MIKGSLYALYFLIAFKVLSNILVLCELVYEGVSRPLEKGRGVSMMLMLEWLLLLLAVGLAAVKDDVWPYGATRVAAIGSAVILASYAAVVPVLCIVRIVLSCYFGRSKDGGEP